MISLLVASIAFTQGLLTRTIHPRAGLYGAVNVMCGIDSLTAGASGTSYLDTLAPRLTGEFGDGGPGYVAFKPDVAGYRTQNGKDIGQNSPTDPSIYSGPLIPEGTFWDPAVKGDFVQHDTFRAWDYATVFYLQRPDGGKFYIRHSLNAFSPDISTAGPLSLQSFTVQSIRSTGSSTLRIDGISGRVTVFGVYYRTISGGAQVSLCAGGGFTLKSVYSINSAWRQKWFAALQPSVILLNTGIPDRTVTTPSVFGNMLAKVILDIVTGSPSTQIVIMQPNESHDSATTYLPQYRAEMISVVQMFPENCTFYSERDLFGTYDQANGDGLMLDVLHPNAVGNLKRTRSLLSVLGMAPNGLTANPGKF